MRQGHPSACLRHGIGRETTATSCVNGFRMSLIPTPRDGRDRRMLFVDDAESHIKVAFLEACRWSRNIDVMILPVNLAGRYASDGYRPTYTTNPACCKGAHSLQPPHSPYQLPCTATRQARGQCCAREDGIPNHVCRINEGARKPFLTGFEYPSSVDKHTLCSF